MAKKNTTSTASTKAGRGRKLVDRLWRVPVQPGGCCLAAAAAALESLGCSREQSTSAAAVPGGDASATTSPAWIRTVYLHKHTGFSILPFIRGSLCLAHPPLLLTAPSRSPSCCQQGCEQLPLRLCTPPAKPYFLHR